MLFTLYFLGSDFFLFYLGFMPQTLSLHAYMTASEILNFYGMIYHLPKCIIQQQMTLLAILGLDKIKDRKISTWSSVSNISSNYSNPLHFCSFVCIFTARSRAQKKLSYSTLRFSVTNSRGKSYK